MDISKTFDQLEDKFYGEWEEDREKLVKEIKALQDSLADDPEASREFEFRVISYFGGAYIPYVFWSQLGKFMDSPEDERPFLQEIIKIFSKSDFEEAEVTKMKPLIVTYFAKEKEFEVNKLRTLVIDKAHPTVKEFFMSMLQFIHKNDKATTLYQLKFDLLKNRYADFSMFNKPLSYLRENV